MHRAFPFKPDNLARPTSNRKSILNAEELRGWLSEGLDQNAFNYSQAIKATDILVFAWSDGHLPWRALGEAVVVSCTRNIPQAGYPFHIEVKEIKVYPSPVDLPKRGRQHLTLTTGEYGSLPKT